MHLFGGTRKNPHIVTSPDGAESTVDDLAALVAFADAVYDRVWAGRKITPSA